MCEETGLQTVLDYEESHFDLQWRRKEGLDSKAANLISLVGIIIGVYAAAGSYLLDKVSVSLWFYLSCILLISGIGLFLFAAYRGIRALGIRKYALGPDPRAFLKAWKDTKKSDTQIALMLALADSSERISAVSDEQARHLESGHKYVVYGLFLTFFFVISLILARILN